MVYKLAFEFNAKDGIYDCIFLVRAISEDHALEIGSILELEHKRLNFIKLLRDE